MTGLKTLTLSAAFGAIGAAAQADTFVIVHGAFQTADSWTAVADALRAAGHTAIAVNLPGRGRCRQSRDLGPIRRNC
jgi:alpha-beta hydrolase superfamily lysophospholipase